MAAVPHRAHDPIVLATRVAGLDVMSGGRMVLASASAGTPRETADHGVVQQPGESMAPFR